MTHPYRSNRSVPARRAAWAAVIAFAIGCGGGTDRSADGLVAAWLQAAHEGRAEDFRAAFPSRAELTEWLECPADVDLASRFDAPNPDLTAWRGTVKLVDTTARARESVAAGGPVGGCVAKVAMTLQRWDATLHDGRVLGLRLLEVDGRYRVLGY